MSLNIMDMHCDTLMKAMLENKQDIYENAATMVDVKRLSDNGYLAQFFAIFVVPETMYREGLHMDPIPSEECILRCHGITRTVLDIRTAERRRSWRRDSNHLEKKPWHICRIKES